MSGIEQTRKCPHCLEEVSNYDEVWEAHQLMESVWAVEKVLRDILKEIRKPRKVLNL